MVLVALGTKLLMWKYCMRLVSSDWASFRSSCSVLAVMMRVVSSAYVYILRSLTNPSFILFQQEQHSKSSSIKMFSYRY